MKKKILALLMMTIFLIGTIGITTYKHICSTDGTSTSFFIPSYDECTAETSPIDNHDCCTKETKAEEKHHCCNDEVRSYKVQSQYNYEVNKVGFASLHMVFLRPIFESFNLFSKGENIRLFLQSTNLNPQPILHEGKRLLGFLRVWRL